MKTGVIYARYSAGPNQTDQSIEGQVRDCQKYAEDNDIKIVKTYIDRHISGTTDNRAQFQKMLKDCEKNIFDYIIVWKIDRFGRNREDIAMNKIRCKKNGVKILYAKEHIPDGPEGIILEGILESFAEYYSAELSQKVKRGMRESALKGYAVGNVRVLGYKVGPDKKFHVDPLTAPIVQLIFSLYADGNKSMKDIIEILNKKGHLTASKKPFSQNSLRSILRNEKYIGIYKYDDIILDDAIEPIVSRETFYKVQERLLINSRCRTRNRAPETFILTPKLKCGLCGDNITGVSGISHTGAKHSYYSCLGRKKKRTCNIRNLKKDYLEDLVINATIQTILKDDVIDILADAILKIQDMESINFELESLKSQRKDVQRKIDNLVAAIEEGIFTSSTKDRLRALEEQKENLNSAIAIEEIEKPDLTKEHILFWFEQFKKKEIHDKEYQESLIDNFVNKILIYDDYIEVYYNYSEETGAEIKKRLDEPGSSNHVEVRLQVLYPNLYVTKKYVIYQITA